MFYEFDYVCASALQQSSISWYDSTDQGPVLFMMETRGGPKEHWVRLGAPISPRIRCRLRQITMATCLICSNQEVLYNRKADLHGTGNHSILD